MFYLALSTLKIDISPALSLKDKRNILRSIKVRLRNSFNVSVAEVQNQGERGDGVLAVVSLSNDAKYLQGQHEKLCATVERYFPGAIGDSDFCLEHCEAPF